MGRPFTLIPFPVIDDSNLIYSSVVEDDHPEYNPGATYSKLQRVIIAERHMVYESLIDNNTDNNPPDNLKTKWGEVGPTNRYAAFDESGGTSTTDNQDIVFKLSGDDVDTMAFLSVVGTTVRVQAEDAGGEYFDETITLNDRAIVSNWWDYLYADFKFQRQVLVWDIPPRLGSTYTITISTRSGVASVATFAMGKAVQYGFTEYDAKIGMIDWSLIDTNDYGRTKLKKGDYKRTMDVKVVAPAGVIDSIGFDLFSRRSTAAVWIAAGEIFELLTLFGYYRDMRIDIPNPTRTYATLQIESFTDAD